MQEFKITFLPENKSVLIERGTDLLTAAIKAGVHIYNSCGGEGICGLCKVIVKEGKFAAELGGISSSFDKKKDPVVLACQTTPESDMEIIVPEESRINQLEILTEEIKTKKFSEFYTTSEDIEEPAHKISTNVFKHNPVSEKIFLKIPAPTIEDNIGDSDRLLRELCNKKNSPAVMQIGLANIKRLPRLLRESNWEITATISNRSNCSEIVLIEPGNTSFKNFGIAIDIGTTTLVIYLVDLNSQKVLSTKACYNPQAGFGEDVISRIIYAQEEKGLEDLHNVLINQINTMISELIIEEHITLDDITSIICAGNTTMTHLLLKIDPTYIRKDPYVPALNSMPVIRASEIGININPKGLLWCLPCIGSYVGGDIASGVLASGMYNSKELCLLIDMGTNGEIVLGNKDWLIACSTSAGPCFEGSGIKSGIRAMKGAIQNIKIQNNKFKIETIGNVLPKGICGSGIIDIVSELFVNKLIDRSGKIKQNKYFKVRQNQDGIKELILVEAVCSAINKDIVIDETDIKNIMHSKGAIYTGIEVLLKETGFKKSDLKRIFIAGGLGTALNIRSAVNIGLLPDCPEKDFIFLGNTSISGAKTCLLSIEAMQQIEIITNKMTYLDLSTNAGFMNNYSASLFLPHTDIELFPSVKKALA